MRILGVDPGLLITGYGVIESSAGRIKLVEAGVIRTSSRDKFQDRLALIYDNLLSVISETSPEVAVIEKLYSHHRHPTTAILMGHARGAVYLAMTKAELAIFEYPAKRVKKATVGTGSATKEQTSRMVQVYLGLKRAPHPVDISDALALAITHAFALKRQGVS